MAHEKRGVEKGVINCGGQTQAQVGTQCLVKWPACQFDHKINKIHLGK